jgi:hypothetical protein
MKASSFPPITTAWHSDFRKPKEKQISISGGLMMINWMKYVVTKL